MSEKKVEDILAGMNPAAKKELLDSLVFALISELNESEKEEMIQTVLSGRKNSRQLASMVGY